jgi:hypothetical protein
MPNMNCPECGIPTSADQQYCRSCGAGLLEERLSGVFPNKFGVLTLFITFIGLMVGIAGKMAEIKWLTFTGVFVVLAGMFLIAAGSMMGSSPRKRRRQRQDLQPVLKAPTTSKL